MKLKSVITFIAVILFCNTSISAKKYPTINYTVQIQNPSDQQKKDTETKELSGKINLSGSLDKRLNSKFAKTLSLDPKDVFSSNGCRWELNGQLSENQKNITFKIINKAGKVVEKKDWSGNLRLFEITKGTMYYLLCDGKEASTLLKQDTGWFVYIPQYDHLNFRDLPIDGKLNNMITQLEELGYTKVVALDNGAVMKGSFTGESATLYLLCTPKSNTVYEIAVSFKEISSWTLLKSEYEKYVKLFTKKYGIPSKHIEEFESPYYEGDGYEIQAIKKGKCNYITVFEAKYGSIYISIEDTCQIRLQYIDDKNYDKKQEEKEKKSIDDI